MGLSRSSDPFARSTSQSSIWRQTQVWSTRCATALAAKPRGRLADDARAADNAVELYVLSRSVCTVAAWPEDHRWDSRSGEERCVHPPGVADELDGGPEDLGCC